MVLQVRLYLTEMPISGTAFGIPLRLGLTASTILLKQSLFQAAFPWLILVVVVLLLSCQPAVWAITGWTHSRNWSWWKNPLKKYKNTRTTAAQGRHRKQQPGNVQAQCYSTKEAACPRTLTTYGNIREKPALREDHPQNYGPHYCFYEKLKGFTARVVNCVNISEIP